VRKSRGVLLRNGRRGLAQGAPRGGTGIMGLTKVATAYKKNGTVKEECVSEYWRERNSLGETREERPQGSGKKITWGKNSERTLLRGSDVGLLRLPPRGQ